MATFLKFNREEDDYIPVAEPDNRRNRDGEFPRSVTVDRIFPEVHGRKPPVKPATTKANPGRLLVVDDEEASFRCVGGVLGRLGFEIIAATSGAQALQKMAACRPDLVLIGRLKAEATGFKLCHVIRENPDWTGIPVMLYSSTGGKGLTARAFENGAADCLIGSFNQAELISRVRAQLSKKAARDHLKQLAEDKEESLGMLMHDLKNHLVGMHMSADVLCEGGRLPDDPFLKLVLENISRTSTQMLSSVNRFLADASAGRGLVLNLEPVSFSEAVARSVEQFQDAARRKELVVNASLPGEDTLVHADPHALNQVLDNLLSNAIKFSPLGKEISVVVRPAAGYVECQVQDQGNGFTPEDRTRMFRRYEKLSARPTGGESSAGLGLSIVKKLVDAMRGELACESTAGSGASFSIRLPRVAGEC